MARKKIHGVDKVLKNLNEELQEIEGRSLKGLIHAGIIVLRSMDSTPPKVPVDTRNLQASQFMVTSRGGVQRGRSPTFKGEDAEKMSSDHTNAVSNSKNTAGAAGQPTVILGFSAYYAWYVHEMVGASFQRPGAGAKFFEAALKRNKDEILKTIAREAKK